MIPQSDVEENFSELPTQSLVYCTLSLPDTHKHQVPEWGQRHSGEVEARSSLGVHLG